MASATFEDHPTDPDKVILRKPRHEDDDDIQEYKKPWVGLTHGEVVDIYEAVMKEDVADLVDNFAKAIEQALKEKNA
jgi:hypothetical protein